MKRYSDKAIIAELLDCDRRDCVSCAGLRELIALRKAARKFDRKMRSDGLEVCYPEATAVLDVLEGR